MGGGGSLLDTIKAFLGIGADPRRGHDLRFGAPVGTVNAPYMQNVILAGLPGAADPRLSPRARLAATLLDRGPQGAAVRERLQRLRRQRDRAPLLVVLPGCATDCHHAFVARFALHDLRAFLPQEEGLHILSTLPWPGGASDVSAILETVRDRLKLPARYDQAAIERYLAEIPASICFSHVIDPEEWETDDGALVQGWVNYIQQHWPASTNFVIAFLCIQLPKPALRKPDMPMVAYLEKLRRNSTPEGRVIVTSDLEQIRSKHINEWIGAVCNLLQDSSLEADLISAPGRLFPDPAVYRPFQEVYEDLVQLLTEVKAFAAPEPMVVR